MSTHCRACLVVQLQLDVIIGAFALQSVQQLLQAIHQDSIFVAVVIALVKQSASG